jgi:hypothetical protein
MPAATRPRLLSDSQLRELVGLHQVRVYGSGGCAAGVLAVVMGSGLVELFGIVVTIAAGCAVVAGLLGLERMKRQELRAGEPAAAVADAAARIRRLTLVGFGIYGVFSLVLIAWTTSRS